MTIPTITYFNGRGLGEVPRLILTLFGQEFKDVRFEKVIPDDIKAKAPYGLVPLYEEDNFILAQSIAIVQYLALKYNIQGQTIQEQAKVSELLHTIQDFISGYWGRDDSDAKKTKFDAVTAPTILKRFNYELTNNGGKHFVGKSLTVADISIFNHIDFLLWKNKDYLNEYPALVEFRNQFATQPKIASYIEKRVDTYF